MNRSRGTAVAYIRQRRKCFSSVEILLLLFSMTILLCQSSNSTSISLFNNDKLEHSASTDVESVEWQQMKMSTDVVLPAQHPVVYKKDYVKQRKDLDETNLDGIARKNQKQLTKQLKAESPNKMDSHVMSHVAADSIAADAGFKLNEAKLQVMETSLKQQLNKTPKKYFAGFSHKRTRRSSESESESEPEQHIVKKRNPYIQHYADNFPSSNHVAAKHNGFAYYTYKSHPVQGNYWNGIDGVVPTAAPQPLFIGERVGFDDEERVVWERFRPATPALGSLFHDSNPANGDTSFLTRRPPTQQQESATTTTRTTQRPVTFGSIFHDSNPANADLSFLRGQTQRQQNARFPQQQRQLPTAIGVKNDKILFRSSSVDDAIEYDDVYSEASEAQARQAKPSDEGHCALAIISCCRHNMKLRLKCFSDWQCKFTTEEVKQKCN